MLKGGQKDKNVSLKHLIHGHVRLLENSHGDLTRPALAKNICDANKTFVELINVAEITLPHRHPPVNLLSIFRTFSIRKCLRGWF